MREPEYEREIVSSVKAVPESTDYKDEELVLGFVFKIVSLIDASVEPMLNVDIPVVDFLSNVNASLDNDDVD